MNDRSPDPRELRRYARNLRDELDGAALYAAIAEAERDPVRKDLFAQLAAAERSHAALWRRRLEAAGAKVPQSGPSLRTRVLAALARRFGAEFVLPAIAANEAADQNKYSGQPDAATLAADERGHAQVLAAAAGQRPSVGLAIGRAEPWHRSASANSLRAAVLGVNDGLVSNFCLLTGVAGAGAAAHVVLLTGLAGLIAGACSMALGEWLSVANAREFARAQLAREADELEQTHEAEEHELALIMQAKGLPKAEAQRAAARIIARPDAALDTLAREELGIDPEELGGNPWTAGGVSFALFSVGALVPVLPLLLIRGASGLWWTVAGSAAALAFVGALTSLFNGRSAPYSAARQLIFGSAAAGITFGLGHLLGVSVS